MAAEQFVRATLLAALLPTAALGACSHRETALERQGKDLFAGAVPLKARMVGHDFVLPPSVVRCQNCHRVSEQPAPVATGPSPGLADKLGPVLSRQSLTEFRQRRGGPFSNYDTKRFCRALRDGIDPAYVMLPSTMPRYAVTKQECQALWAYLVQP